MFKMRLKVLLVAMLFCLVSAKAMALDAQLFEANTDSKKRLGVYDSETLRMWGFNSAIYFHYADRPLTFSRSGEQSEPIVDYLASGNLVLALGVSDFINIGLDVPFVMSESFRKITSSEEDTNFGLGDLRIDIKATMLDPERYPVGLALIPQIVANTGEELSYAGEEDPQFGLLMVVDARFGKKVAALINLGYRKREQTQVLNVDWSNEILFRAALDIALDKHSSVMGELWGTTDAGDPFAHSTELPVEGLIGYRYRFSNGFGLIFAAGAGITRGLGAPTFRGIMKAQFQRAVLRDSDLDGIYDEDDSCPNAAEDRDGYLDRDGCPDVDNDNDGILDIKDRCPNEAENANHYMDHDGCPEPDPSSILTVTVLKQDGSLLTDNLGRPLSAKIVLEPKIGAPGQTEPSTGIWTTPIGEGKFLLTIRAKGYNIFSKPIYIKPRKHLKLRITMQPSMRME
jgi:large repetitive protein